MTKPSETSTPRRQFLGQLATTAVALAGTACASPIMVAQSAPSPAASPAGERPIQTTTAWDNSWFDRLTAKHKAVFDSPDVEEGDIAGPGEATRFINGLHDALGVSSADVQTVIVIRHKAIPFALNDAMWAKYEIGKDLQIKGNGEDWATKNPFAATRSGGNRGGRGAGAPAGAPVTERPQANAAWLTAHNHILLGCDMATQGYAGKTASRTKGTMKAIYEEFKANLVPGMILQPNGVYATLRAQEAGCAFMR